MPRASDGSYSLPAGSLVNVGEDIVPSQHNPPLTDIAQAIAGSLSRDGLGGMRNNLNMGNFRATNMANGVQPTDGVNMQQLAAAAGGIQAGSVIDFAGTNPPIGWLLCAGQTLSRSDYPDLFAAIGTTYGAPSGATFNLPDCRGRVSAGRDVDQGGFADRLTTPNSRTLGASGGAQSVALTTAQLAAHTHEVSGSTNAAGDHAHTLAYSDGGVAGVRRVTANQNSTSGNISTDTAGSHSHTITVTAGNTGSGEAHPNVQPVIVFTKIIKVSNS